MDDKTLQEIQDACNRIVPLLEAEFKPDQNRVILAPIIAALLLIAMGMLQRLNFPIEKSLSFVMEMFGVAYNKSMVRINAHDNLTPKPNEYVN